MHMQKTFDPIPAKLHGRIRAMTHDLRRARELTAAGHITPEGKAALDRFLALRISRIEAEVQSRLLQEAQRGQRMVWGRNS